MAEMTNGQPLPPDLMAFVIDGEVVFLLRTQDPFSAVLTSSPTIVKVTEEMEGKIQLGWKYDGTTFTESSN
jgi:hypothetical protein